MIIDRYDPVNLFELVPILREFCRFYLEPAPDDTTLIRWANAIGA